MVIAIAVQEEEARYEPDVVDEGEDDSYPIDQYDLVSSPNDFNTRTIVDFIDSGAITIPGFQRNYVWDAKRASRLIESIIVGLPIPQVFLYEQDRDKFLVIDGQQRLMSIYYFVKERFPRKEKLLEISTISEGSSRRTEDVLANDTFFTNFQLDLPENAPGHPNRFHRRRYSDLDPDYKTRFDLRTIRNVIVRQVHPQGDDAMYEIFNRLNSGGVNLTPQEIRRCMYYSDFYEMLYRVNSREQWRNLVGARAPDTRMKDVEILLRGFAMLINGDDYRPSMVKFLNRFSQNAKSFDDNHLRILDRLLQSFLDSCHDLPNDAFHSNQNRFSPMIFEAAFVAICADPYSDGDIVHGTINAESLLELKNDQAFQNASQRATTQLPSVLSRLARAKELVVVE